MIVVAFMTCPHNVVALHILLSPGLKLNFISIADNQTK